jgi:flagellar export protein FliJ
MEQYSRLLVARQQGIDALENVRARIAAHWNDVREKVRNGCKASEISRLQEFEAGLDRRQNECIAALQALERGVNVASQAMLAARQQREIVDRFRGKQWDAHRRADAREEQKTLDEFASRRSTAIRAVA